MTENTLVKSEWNWSFTLILKKCFAFFSAPASHALLGKRQKYRSENIKSALEEAINAKDHEKNEKS